MPIKKKVITLFILNRTGTFVVDKISSNQCKAEFHRNYRYKIQIVYSGKLDENGFIIDQLVIHNAILETIKAKKKMFSCEELCIIVSEVVIKECNKAKVLLDRVYCKILPLPFNRSNNVFMELETIINN